MTETTKNATKSKGVYSKALYATVGGPVLTAKRVNEKFADITARLRDINLSDGLKKEFDAWAAEGEKLVDRLGDQPVIEEWTAKLDDIKVPEGVSKLRGQLDDMVANWRDTFRPTTEVPAEETPKPTPKKATATKAATAKKPAAKKATAAKKPAAKKTTTKATSKK